ncbi:YutD family protein [Brevibacillus daliensis]|uniref:YutD family protein n=1 Tax=Brevibacillus daliensis TaxID=2892995 RepID=UPI001E39E60C|nr:YutD family protein [Brevibacillus daliensis]
MIRLQAGVYELIEENREGWNLEVCKERYSDVLDKYDFIVGDWGYGQLRLRGFFDNSNRKVPFEQKIAALDEYLQEYCNFGCAYFVLKRTKRLTGNEPQDEMDLIVESPEQEGSSSAQSPSPSRPRSYERAIKRRSDRGDKPGRSPRQDRSDREGKEKQLGSSPKGSRAEQGNKERKNYPRPPRDKVAQSQSSNKKPPQTDK